MSVIRGCQEGKVTPKLVLVKYPDVVRAHMGIPDGELVAMGIALGHESTARINGFDPGRADVSSFLFFKD